MPIYTLIFYKAKIAIEFDTRVIQKVLSLTQKEEP